MNSLSDFIRSPLWGVPLVMVLEPAGKLDQDRCRIGTGVDTHIDPFEGIHKGLGHAVAFWLRVGVNRQSRRSRDANAIVFLAV